MRKIKCYRNGNKEVKLKVRMLLNLLLNSQHYEKLSLYPDTRLYSCKLQ